MERLIVCETDKGNYAVRPSHWAGIWNAAGKIRECGLNHTAVFHYKEDADWYAESKNLEEQGKLLRLPCKVGDIVYCWRKVVPTRYHNFNTERWLETDNDIIPARVVNIKILKNRTTIKVALKGRCFVKNFPDSEFMTRDDFEYCCCNLSIGAFGKTVFLTREEAEAALERMKGE